MSSALQPAIGSHLISDAALLSSSHRSRAWPRGAFGQVVHVLLVLLLCLAASACRGRAPYEGKSAAQLEAMLKSSNTMVQAQGAYGLSQLGPEGRSAVGALIEALQNPETLVRQNAALALGAIGPESAEAVPALTATLKDSEWIVRRQTALALGQIGPAAVAAAPALKQLSRDSHKPVRDAAREALAKVEANK